MSDASADRIAGSRGRSPTLGEIESVPRCEYKVRTNIVAEPSYGSNQTCGSFDSSGLEGLLDEPRPGAPRTIMDAGVAVITKTVEKTRPDAALNHAVDDRGHLEWIVANSSLNLSDETVMRLRGLPSSILVGLVTVACGGSSTSPAAPTGTAISRNDPTVFMITIDRDRETRVNNRTMLFTAIARMSNGSQKDVTALADWRSSNPAVATVEAGRVSVLDSGELTLSAAYRGAVAQIHVGVTIAGDALALALAGGSS